MQWEHRTVIRANKNEAVLKLRATTFINNLQPEESREFDVVVTLHKNQRSLEQNAYFHGVIVPYCARELGYTQREAKAVLKAELLPLVPIKKLNGEITHELTHTSSLKTKEMGDFIDQCIMLLAAHGVIVPHPTYKGIGGE